jgi:hypothetical protein
MGAIVQGCGLRAQGDYVVADCGLFASYLDGLNGNER